MKTLLQIVVSVCIFAAPSVVNAEAPQPLLFGLQDCPGGVCPLPTVTRQVTRAPMFGLRRRTVQRTVTYTPPDTYQVPTPAPVVQAAPVYCEPVESASVVYTKPVYTAPVYTAPVYSDPVYFEPVYHETSSADICSICGQVKTSGRMTVNQVRNERVWFPRLRAWRQQRQQRRMMCQ